MAALGLHADRLWNADSGRAAREHIRARRPGRSLLSRLFAAGDRVTVSLPASIGRKMLRKAPTWRARVGADLLKPRVVMKLPLHAGWRVGDLRLLKVEKSGVRAVLTTSESLPLASPVVPVRTSMFAFPGVTGPEYGLVYSRDRRRVASLGEQGLFVHQIGRVDVIRRQFVVRAPTKWRRGRHPRGARQTDPEWPGWLDHATLGVVTFDRVGRFETTLHRDRLVVKRAQDRRTETRLETVPASTAYIRAPGGKFDRIRADQ